MIKILKTQQPTQCCKGFVLVDKVTLVVLGHAVNADNMIKLTQSQKVQMLGVALVFMIMGLMMGIAI